MSDWIKFEKDRRGDPRVLRMARQLRDSGVTHERLSGNAHVTIVLGCLAVLWSYADTHIRDDDTLALGVDEIDELVGLKGFCSIMPPDWLQVLDAQTVKLPEFHTHNGSTAKSRAQGQKRVERHREKQRYDTVTTALPEEKREEESRGDKNKIAASPRRVPRETDSEELLDYKLAMPERDGAQPWRRALSAIHARLREGHTKAEIIAGMERYAAWCKAGGKLGTETVMQAASFCGPELHFTKPWAIAPSTAERKETDELQKLRDRREAVGLADFRDPRAGETAAQYRKAQDEEWNRRKATSSALPLRGVLKQVQA